MSVFPGSTIARSQLDRKLSSSCSARDAMSTIVPSSLQAARSSGTLRQGGILSLRRGRWILLIRHASIKRLWFAESAVCM